VLRPRAGALEDQERKCLGLLASAMFAEARELGAGSALASCLSAYVVQLLHPERRHPSSRGAYEITSPADVSVFRRLATSMDSLSLSLGPGSGVGRALSNWAARVNLAVAEAESRHALVDGPPEELLAMAAALGTPQEPGTRSLAEGPPELLAPAAEPSEPPGHERPGGSGRLWSRAAEEGSRSRRRRR
jgi:hypothetical protein